MGETAQIGRRFEALRKAKRLSREGAAALLGCSPRTVANFERGEVTTEGDTVLQALKLINMWEQELRVPHAADGKHVRTDLTMDPLQIVIGGLVNTVALLRDESIPLRARLLHTRAQLEFLQRNFLSDASIPD